MSGAVKTGLIVAASAGGAYLLFKAFAPPPATVRKQAQSGIANLSGIGELAGGLLGGLFGGSSSKPTGYTSAPSADNSVGYDSGESFDDYVSGMFGPGIPTYD